MFYLIFGRDTSRAYGSKEVNCRVSMDAVRDKGQLSHLEDNHKAKYDVK